MFFYVIQKEGKFINVRFDFLIEVLDLLEQTFVRGLFIYVVGVFFVLGFLYINGKNSLIFLFVIRYDLFF